MEANCSTPTSPEDYQVSLAPWLVGRDPSATTYEGHEYKVQGVRTLLIELGVDPNTIKGDGGSTLLTKRQLMLLMGRQLEFPLPASEDERAFLLSNILLRSAGTTLRIGIDRFGQTCTIKVDWHELN